MAEDEEITDAYVRRLANLGPYKGKSPDEIRDMVRAKRAALPATKSSKSDKAYDERFKEKWDAITREFAVDINDSNDAESLNNFIRLQIQSENVDKDIRAIQDQPSKSKDDVVVLKSLGDFQRNIQMSLKDIQEKLGISRQQRKEKVVDDIPQWIDGVLRKSKEFFDRKTVIVECPKCEIELVRFWENFPDLVTILEVSSECPHCGEIVRFNR